MSDEFDLWMEYKKEFKTNEEAQDCLRNRMLKFIKETKIKQREIAKHSKISESVLSQWKNNRDIGFSDNNKLLHVFDAGRLHRYLCDRGY